MPLRCYPEPPETDRYRVVLHAAPYEEAEDAPQLNPLVNEPVITGQTWRVNSFVPLSALSSRRRVPTLTGSHSTAKSPVRGPGWARLDVIPVYRDSCDFPFGNFSATFELKTHGANRANLPLLRAISGEARFRNIRGDFPFGKRVPSTVPASRAVLPVNAATLSSMTRWRRLRAAFPVAADDGERVSSPR